MSEVLDGYYLISALKLFIKILLVFVCFTSVLLLAAPAVFGKIAHTLQKRHGWKKELFPWLEGDKIVIDHFLYNHRKIIGILTIAISIILFTILR
jgi:hypothetical protein